MIFVLNSAGVRVFFAHFFEEKFCGGHPSAGGEAMCVGVLCEGGFVCWAWP